MTQMRTVIYYAPKYGNDESEWEDGAAGFPADGAGHGPRFAVADGATQGFGSARWAQQLVAGFVGADRAVLRPRCHRPPCVTGSKPCRPVAA